MPCPAPISHSSYRNRFPRLVNTAVCSDRTGALVERKKGKSALSRPSFVDVEMSADLSYTLRQCKMQITFAVGAWGSWSRFWRRERDAGLKVGGRSLSKKEPARQPFWPSTHEVHCLRYCFFWGGGSDKRYKFSKQLLTVAPWRCSRNCLAE